VSKTIDRLVRPEVQAMQAYHVQSAGDMIKLDAMENPYDIPAELRPAWLELLSTAAVNRYPNPSPTHLVDLLRATQNIPDSAEVILGNGSDELIQIICMSVAALDRVVLSVTPTFVIFEQAAKLSGMRYEAVPLRADFSLDLSAMLAAIETHQPAVIFLAYPNNPTGHQWEKAEVLQIIAAAPGLVVIDEAYGPFAADTLMPELMQHDNMLLMRTLSKYGLAGCRFGYLSGPKDWLEQLNKVRMPYNINVLTQATVQFALQHNDAFIRQAEAIKSSRLWLIEKMRALTHLQVHDSQANFIIFKVPHGQADTIFEALKVSGVLIKNMSPQGGLLTDYLRVTVGTPEENQIFVDALTRAVTPT